MKSRRLFRQLNYSQESLIEPVHLENSDDVIKTILPKAVQKGILGSAAKHAKRTSFALDNDGNDAKRQCISPGIDYVDISFPKRKRSTPVTVPAPAPIPPTVSQLFQSPNRPPKATTAHQPPLSPLVTRQPSRTPSLSGFVTPKINRRRSLRTRLLKQSAKKLYRQLQSDGVDIDATDWDKVLVPQTVTRDRHMTGPIVDYPGVIETIKESPRGSDLSSSFGSDIVGVANGDSGPGDSLSSSVLCSMLDTPNITRQLAAMCPGASVPATFDHPLFVAKARHYDHCVHADQPSFREQARYIGQEVVRPSADDQRQLFDGMSPVVVAAAAVTAGSAGRSRAKCRVTRSSVSGGVLPSDESQQRRPIATSSPMPPVVVTATRPARANCRVTRSSAGGYRLSDVSVVVTPMDMSGVEPTEETRQLAPIAASSPMPPPTPAVSGEVAQRRVTRRSSAISGQAKPLWDMISASIDVVDVARVTVGEGEEKPVSRKRAWSKVGKTGPKPVTAVVKEDKPKRMAKKPRDSIDDFITSYPAISNGKATRISGGREMVLVGFSVE